MYAQHCVCEEWVCVSIHALMCVHVYSSELWGHLNVVSGIWDNVSSASQKLRGYHSWHRGHAYVCSEVATRCSWRFHC